MLDEAAMAYGLARDRMVAVGYSNGANIAHATMLLRPDSFAGAALLHAQFVLAPDPLPSLVGRAVFLAAGKADPIVPIAEARRLADTLAAAGATVTPFWSRGGHGLTGDDVEHAQAVAELRRVWFVEGSRWIRNKSSVSSSAAFSGARRGVRAAGSGCPTSASAAVDPATAGRAEV